MKVQIQGQSMRLRIDEDELARLQAGGVVENVTVLALAVTCRQSVRVTAGEDVALAGSGEEWSLGIPADAFADYVQRLPCRDGLEFSLPAGNGQMLRANLQVDVRDSVRRRVLNRKSKLSVAGRQAGAIDLGQAKPR